MAFYFSLGPCSVDFLDGRATNVSILGPVEEKNWVSVEAGGTGGAGGNDDQIQNWAKVFVSDLSVGNILSSAIGSGSP